MSECLAVEKAYGRRYAQWQEDLGAGSAEAMCVLAWIIWRRDGRDVPYTDILDGTADFDLLEMLNSIAESAAADAEEAPDPPITPGGPDPAGTDSTGTGTSASSPSGSTSGRGKSKKSSASRTSRP